MCFMIAHPDSAASRTGGCRNTARVRPPANRPERQDVTHRESLRCGPFTMNRAALSASRLEVYSTLSMPDGELFTASRGDEGQQLMRGFLGVGVMILPGSVERSGDPVAFLPQRLQQGNRADGMAIHLRHRRHQEIASGRGRTPVAGPQSSQPCLMPARNRSTRWPIIASSTPANGPLPCYPAPHVALSLPQSTGKLGFCSRSCRGSSTDRGLWLGEGSS